MGDVSRFAVLAHGGQVVDALALAARICVSAPVAVQLSREIVPSGCSRATRRPWRITDAATQAVMGTEDFGEGPRAYIEKREPVWSGG